ncbi:MAG: hypothetical protein PSV22_23945 [Pseudolabrys sp.]|nr:hypothetical protein [Pseudolabrys sp.]
MTLDAPLILARWSKNRSGAAITITLKTYEGANIFDLRTFMSDRGVLKPAKGFACMVSHLPRLAKEIAKAVETAIELGLIDGAAK